MDLSSWTEEPGSLLIEPAIGEDEVDAMPSAVDDYSGSVDLRVGHPQAGGAATPRVDVQMAIATRSGRRGHGSQVIGQMLAYAGVLALTVGTSLVIWSYFGGLPNYAPTGWLVATGGQMLLFLGVVTLVAGGLEQTNADVAARVETISERLVRIEQILARGPSQSGISSPGHSEHASPTRHSVRRSA